jgi:predicted transcriptional regulator
MPDDNTSAFLTLIGNVPAMKIIDFLIRNSPGNFNKTEIAEHLMMGRSTLHKSWKVLDAFDITKTQTSKGKSRFYVLNKENPIVTLLLKLYQVMETAQ